MTLTVPLDPVAGLAASLAALTVGHHQTASHLRPLSRWSFAGGSLVPHGPPQGVCLIAAAVAASRHTPWSLAPLLPAAALSLWFYGRRFEAALVEQD